VQSAQLGVAKAEKALAATKLYAPMAGTIAAIGGAVGETVGSSSSASGSSGSADAGSTAAVAGGLGGSGGGSGSTSGSSTGSSSAGFITLAQLSRYTMDVSLSESDIGKVKVGQQATVTVNAASGAQFAARVQRVGVLSSSSSSSGAVSYPVTLRLSQTDSKLKAGMSATADIVVSQASGVTVPSQAVQAGSVTLVRNGRRTTQRVQTGVVGDSSTQILSGLKAGDEVVVRSASAAAGAAAGSAASSTGDAGRGRGIGGAVPTPGGGGGFGGGGFAAGAGGPQRFNRGGP
jgi:multidrug efflux pump subunit AcrA (membrane-fusion protein)